MIETESEKRDRREQNEKKRETVRGEEVSESRGERWEEIWRDSERRDRGREGGTVKGER